MRGPPFRPEGAIAGRQHKEEEPKDKHEEHLSSQGGLDLQTMFSLKEWPAALHVNADVLQTPHNSGKLRQ